MDKEIFNSDKAGVTSSVRTAKQIRKELAILIQEKKKVCLTEKEKNQAVNEARMEINKKHGKDWRGREEAKAFKRNRGHDEPSIYDGHTYGEHWMD